MGPVVGGLGGACALCLCRIFRIGLTLLVFELFLVSLVHSGMAKVMFYPYNP